MYFCRNVIKLCKSIKVYNKAFQPGTRIKEFNIYVSLIAEDIIRCLQRQENTEESFKFNEAYGKAARERLVILRILIMMWFCGQQKSKDIQANKFFFIAGLLLIKVLTWKLVFTHFFPPSLGRKATQQNTRVRVFRKKEGL